MFTNYKEQSKIVKEIIEIAKTDFDRRIKVDYSYNQVVENIEKGAEPEDNTRETGNLVKKEEEEMWKAYYVISDDNGGREIYLKELMQALTDCINTKASRDDVLWMEMRYRVINATWKSKAYIYIDWVVAIVVSILKFILLRVKTIGAIRC